jgi:hypothetical protein
VALLLGLHLRPHAVAARPLARRSALHANGTYLDRQTGMRVTIAKVLADPRGDQFFKPDAHKMFAMLYVRFHNSGQHSRDVNPLDFQLVDAGGQSYDSTTFLPTRYVQIDAVGVPAGESRAGWIGYMIPTSTRHVTVTWDDASSLDPPAEIGRYTLILTAPSNYSAGIHRLSPAQEAVATAVYGFQDALHDIYSPQYSISILGNTAVGTAAQAVYCTATNLSNNGTYLTYNGEHDRFQSISVNGDSAQAVVHIDEHIETHHSDGSVSASHATYTATYDLSLFVDGWKVSDYTWVADDGSTGGASKDAAMCSTT